MSRMNPTELLMLCGAALLSVPAPMAAQELGPPEDQKPKFVVTAWVVAPELPAPSRPAALAPLYAALSGLQVYDGYSTIRGVREGQTETNPLVGGLSSRPALLWPLKVGSAALSIYLAEQCWRDHHPKRAIATMIVANGVMAAVAAHNASLLKSR